MPANGLCDNKVMIKMMAMKKGLFANKLEPFSKFKEEILAKIESLKSLDRETEIVRYCESLVEQVMKAIDQAFEHINYQHQPAGDSFKSTQDELGKLSAAIEIMRSNYEYA